MRKQNPALMEGDSREAYIRRLIANMGLTIKEFADKAKIPAASLNTILRRGIGSTALDTAIKIADALDMDLDSLARYDYYANYYSGTSEIDEKIIDISRRLRNTRYTLLYREVALAELLDISIEHYRRFESSHYNIPTKYIRRLSQIMGVSFEYLMCLEDSEPAIDGLFYEDSPEEFEKYDLGKAVFEMRTKCGLSIDDLAFRLKKTTKTIQQWENRIQVPSKNDLIMLYKLCYGDNDGLTLETLKSYLIQNPDDVFSDKEIALIQKYREAEEKNQRIVNMVLDVD